jgi:hypothetical protein
MTTTHTQVPSVTTENEYFDLHTSGVGYVNRIREVTPRKGEHFWACNLSALRGSKSAVDYTYFDCRVSGSEASKVIKRLEKSGQEKKSILIGFKIGDQYSETFVYKSGQKKGETGICTKAHLLFISWVKINGDTVYTAPKPESVNTAETLAATESQNHQQAEEETA